MSDTIAQRIFVPHVRIRVIARRETAGPFLVVFTKRREMSNAIA
jgi:hypothetical protein